MIPKFRCWVKPEKRMIETNDILAIDYEYEEVETQFIDGLPEDRDLESFPFDDIIFTQSTGLKDKNGKEIFEGDILGIETDEGQLNVNVFWDSKHALFMFESKKHNEKELLAELVEDNNYPFEIIGNIYENKELLDA